MNVTRFFSYLLAGVALVLSMLAYANYVYMLGFPDGFISGLARAQRRLAYIFILASSVFILVFIYQGIVAKKPGKALGISITLYVLMLVVLLLFNAYYGINLTDSTGG